MRGVKGVINWVEVMAWSALIFSFSGESFTASRTLIALKFWVELLNLPLDPAALYLIHAALRKGGHFGEFFILGLLLYRVLSTASTRVELKYAGRVIAVGVLLAVTDEVHQVFVSGRSPSLFDAALDSAGVLASQVWIVSRARWRRWRQPAKECRHEECGEL